MKDIKLLIIDDEPDLLEVCLDAFEMEDFICYGALNGKEGLQVLDNNPDIKIVICDANMPVMGGLELLDIASVKFQDLNFFLATGDIDITDNDIKKKGGAGLLSKPYDIDVVIEKIKVLVKK